MDRWRVRFVCEGPREVVGSFALRLPRAESWAEYLRETHNEAQVFQLLKAYLCRARFFPAETDVASHVLQHHVHVRFWPASRTLVVHFATCVTVAKTSFRHKKLVKRGSAVRLAGASVLWSAQKLAQLASQHPGACASRPGQGPGAGPAAARTPTEQLAQLTRQATPGWSTELAPFAREVLPRGPEHVEQALRLLSSERRPEVHLVSEREMAQQLSRQQRAGVEDGFRILAACTSNRDGSTLQRQSDAVLQALRQARRMYLRQRARQERPERPARLEPDEQEEDQTLPMRYDTVRDVGAANGLRPVLPGTQFGADYRAEVLPFLHGARPRYHVLVLAGCVDSRGGNNLVNALGLTNMLSRPDTTAAALRDALWRLGDGTDFVLNVLNTGPADIEAFRPARLDWAALPLLERLFVGFDRLFAKTGVKGLYRKRAPSPTREEFVAWWRDVAMREPLFGPHLRALLEAL